MKTLTYGTLPSREAYEAAFFWACGGSFHFMLDPRVGTCELTCSELWGELSKARGEWESAQEDGTTLTEADMDAAGQWCSDVLGVLGFEWV